MNVELLVDGAYILKMYSDLLFLVGSLMAVYSSVLLLRVDGFVIIVDLIVFDIFIFLWPFYRTVLLQSIIHS